MKDIQSSCFLEIHYSHASGHSNIVVTQLARRVVSISQMLVGIEDVPPDIIHIFQAGLNDLL